MDFLWEGDVILNIILRVRPVADIHSTDNSSIEAMLPKRKKSQLAAELGRFVQQYARKAHKNWDPNDRSYDRKLEEKMKRLSPEELSNMLSGEDIEPVEPHSKPMRNSE